jgi:2'-5' RNA ligase
MRNAGNWTEANLEGRVRKGNYSKLKLKQMEFVVSKQSKKTSLFFIALIPNKELRMKINAIKSDFKRFESSRASKVYTHITLKAPFKCSINNKKELLNWFSQMVIRQKPFSMDLDGFGAFYNKYNPVVFINPVINKEIIKMQKELMISFNSIFPAYVHPVDRNFKPHITVAYRDLTPENFLNAWKEYKYKAFNDVFDVNAIYLLEHDTNNWNIIDTHKLG